MGQDMQGMDTRTNCSSKAKDIKKVGMEFVIRYYSHNQSNSKNLTKSEAIALSKAGLDIISVFENSPTSYKITDAH